MAVNYYIDKRQNKDGQSPWRISWTFRGERVMTTMGCTVMPQYWDQETQTVKEPVLDEGQLDATIINMRLNEIRRSILKIESIARASSLRTIYKDEMSGILNRLLNSGIEMEPIVRSVAYSWNVNYDAEEKKSETPKTAKEKLSELMDMILEGEIEEKYSTCTLFGGADVIVTDTHIEELYRPCTVVETSVENARAFSGLLYELRDNFCEYIPFERALFYTRIAMAANRYLQAGNDTKGLLLAAFAELSIHILACTDMEHLEKMERIRTIIAE